MHLALSLLSLFLLVASTSANSTDEIIVAAQKAIEQGDSLREVEDSISNLSIAEGKKLSADFERGWTSLRARYLSNLDRHTKELFEGSARRDNQKRVRELRESFHKIRQLSEDQMKERLKKESMPALLELKSLLQPSPKDVLSSAPDALKKERKVLRGFAEFRDLIQEYTVSVGENDSTASLQQAENAIIAEFHQIDRAGKRIIENNDKIALKANLPEAERQGIRELNEWRLLLEQNALTIDPKLCDAARGHSQDMQEHGFFAHISPVKGKRTPSDRAKAAGTTGGGENIFMGAPRPEAANKGWFFSPGHHKNLFNPRYKKVGLGQYNRHWTQMFG